MNAQLRMKDTRTWRRAATFVWFITAMAACLCVMAGTSYAGSEETAPPTTWALDTGVNMAWKAPLAASSAAAPMVHDGAVYVLADPDILMCLEMATGAQRWQSFVGLAATDNPEADAKARALFAKASVTDWRERASLYEEAARVLGVKKCGCPELGFTVGKPVTDGKRIYVSTGLGTVAAFDPAGKRLWRVESLQKKGGNWSATPLLVEGHLIVGSSGILAALDPATGAVRWNAPLLAGGRIGTSAVWSREGVNYLVVSDGTVVRAGDGKVMSAEGRQGSTGAGPVIAGDRVFFTRGDDHNHGEQYVEALDLKVEGARVVLSPAWKTPDRRGSDKTFAFTRVTPVVVGDCLVSIVPSRNTVRLESLADGSPRDPGVAIAMAQAHHTWRPEPVAAAGHFYLPSNAGVVSVLKIEKGAWRLVHTGDFGAASAGDKDARGASSKNSGTLRAGLVVADGRLLVRTADALFCLSTRAGKEKTK